MQKKESYGLFTIITMIVGIVIGSGIYFRADDVFSFTNGNVLLALLSLSLGAICITFGSLSLATLASRCDKSGGMVAYFDEFFSRNMACGFGWFQLFIYSPAITVVVSWAAAIYTFMLLGKEVDLFWQILLGTFYSVVLICLNYLSRRMGGFVQNIATTIKVIPLILIAIYGIFFAPEVESLQSAIHGFSSEFKTMGWLAALVPLMYSYDGWTFALNIAPEVKDSKRNMRKALILAPFIILFIYLMFLFGMYRLLGSQALISLGDSAVFEAAKVIGGVRFGNIVLVVIIISVLGVLNGLCLSSIRLPQAMAEKKMIADHGLSEVNPKYQLSFRSTGMFLLLLLFWTGIHYIVMKFQLLGGRDISEISIVFAYMIYALLYFAVFRLSKKEKNIGNMIFSILAILGSLAIFIGSLITSPLYVILFLITCALVSYAGYRYSLKQSQ